MPKRIDLTGRVFGELQVIKLSDKKTANNTRLWECKCSCGNIVYVPGPSLVHGHYKSCGCKHAEKLYKGSLEHIKKDSVDGTRKSALKAKLHKGNKSGHKGVAWNKHREKWTATIGFKGKQIFLGNYEHKEDAIKARQRAEEEYHQPYLDK
jgi:hypothetical protein